MWIIVVQIIGMKGQISVRNAEWTIVTSLSQPSSLLAFSPMRLRNSGGCMASGEAGDMTPTLVVAKRTLERLCGFTAPSLA